MTINLRFTAKDWNRIRHDWTAWWEGELNRPMVIVHAIEFYGNGKFTVQEFGGWDVTRGQFPIEPVLDHYQMVLEGEIFYGDSWPRWWPNFGPGIMAGFLGAKVNNDDRTVWFEPESKQLPQNIHPIYAPDNFWWQWVQAITQAAVDRWGSQVTIAHTDLGGNLDIIASLRNTQDLLFDLYDAPSEINRLVREVNRLWLGYYDRLYRIIEKANAGTTAWTPLWCPERYYMLQCDFSYMISPEMFERFVLPDLEACCKHLEYAFYHLDGKGQIPHLDMLLSIEDLKGVQWVPGDGEPPAANWLPLLKKIRDAGKLVNVYATPEGARKIVQEIGGRGFALWVTESIPQAEVEGFFKSLAEEDITGD